MPYGNLQGNILVSEHAGTHGGALIEDFNTVDVTAKILKADRKTIYGAIERKEIPCIKIGRLIRVPGAWLRGAAGLSNADGDASTQQPSPVSGR